MSDHPDLITEIDWPDFLASVPPGMVPGQHQEHVRADTASSRSFTHRPPKSLADHRAPAVPEPSKATPGIFLDQKGN